MLLPNFKGRCAVKLVSLCLFIFFSCFTNARGQQAADRIASVIENNRRVTLPFHTNPRIQAALDQGPVDPSMELPYVTLVLQPSAAQQADLQQLTAQQQDPASAAYHQWLTPEEYAARFGVSQGDLEKIAGWLAENGLTVKSTARARNAIAFSGTAGHIGSAFGMEIHRYMVEGQLHYANAADPSIPAALSGVVLALHGLTNFRMKPRLKRALQPRYTTSGGTHELGPTDIATIYDITPLYNAGIDGNGEKLAVAGQTDINISDIQQFRNFFGLPANNPTVILMTGSQDPGTMSSSGDLGEADLDLELSGAVARNATVLYVNSTDVMTSLQYAIDQNLAPVVSMSYGDCELDTGSTEARVLQTWATQANAQGQTIFAASGDAGAADCFGIGDSASIDQALSVDLPGALPEVTSVGGTEIAEGSGSYWNAKNGTGEASALRYMPETGWNDSITDGQPSASGGGKSTFFSKPSWQTGTGVPADGARDVPDISLSASADHDPYQMVTGGQISLVGGTSVGAPQFAGIAVLLNQYLVANGFQSKPGLGNINPTLYALAPVSGVYHDITSGTNIVTPCTSQRCTAAAVGYSAGVGYDLVTGLGTPDVYNLVTSWHSSSVSSRESVAMKLASSAASVTFSGSTVLTATITSGNGGTPTGTVAFTTGTYTLGTATMAGSGGSSVAVLTLGGVQLAAGSNTITASYSGDNAYLTDTATAAVTVSSAAGGAPVIGGISNAASFEQAFAPGAILSVFGTNLAPAVGSAPSVPLPGMLAGMHATINGVIAPLYYVSTTQLNVQIPYETAAGPATLTVTNNGKTSTYDFQVAAAAPGIFTFNGGAPVPFATAARSQVLTMYVTGAGAVSPAVATGSTPAAGTPAASLPKPAGKLSVTVGGLPATLNFVGIPTWSVGVVQINYTVPANAPIGSEAVVISVGGVNSAVAHLTVTQ